jgi:hypothetical protein
MTGGQAGNCNAATGCGTNADCTSNVCLPNDTCQ